MLCVTVPSQYKGNYKTEIDGHLKYKLNVEMKCYMVFLQRYHDLWCPLNTDYLLNEAILFEVHRVRGEDSSVEGSL